MCVFIQLQTFKCAQAILVLQILGPTSSTEFLTSCNSIFRKGHFSVWSTCNLILIIDWKNGGPLVVPCAEWFDHSDDAFLTTNEANESHPPLQGGDASRRSILHPASDWTPGTEHFVVQTIWNNNQCPAPDWVMWETAAPLCLLSVIYCKTFIFHQKYIYFAFR